MAKPATTNRSPRAGRAIGRLALVAAIALVCFYPVTKYFFLQDDFILIANAAYERDTTVMETIGGDSDLFRPLTKILYFGVMYGIFGLNALPYHIVSLAVHLLNVGLLFLLLRKLRNDRLSSLFVTAIYALHLGFFDVLAWISCIQQLMGQAFMLCGLLLGIHAIETKRGAFASIGASIYALALLSLEQTYALPLLLFSYSYLKGGVEPARKRLPRALRETVPYLLVMVVYLGYMAVVKGVPTEGPYRYQLGANVIVNLLTYLDWAVGISTLMPFVVDVSATGLTAAHVLIAAVVVYNLAKGRGRIVLFSSAYYLFTILPVLFLKNHVFHLHNYVPAVGIAVLLAPVVEDLFSTVRQWRARAASATAWGLIAMLAIMCFTKARANETNFLRPDLPLPKDFVLRRAIIAENVLEDLRSKTRFDRPPRRLFMVYKSETGWYKENVIAALGGESALRLFYSDPDLIVTFADRGDTLSNYEPQTARIFFFDYMGHLFTPEEIGGEPGSGVRTVEPETR
jgi:hypothetical protein